MVNQMYNKEVMKHFLNPRNMGEIKNPDAVGEVGNFKCGDVMKVYINVDKKSKDEKNSKIKDIKFQTFGCVAAIASTDIVCDIVKGKTIKEAKKLSKKDILKKLGGLPGIKIHCSVLAEDAIKSAINDYRKKQGLEELIFDASHV